MIAGFGEQPILLVTNLKLRARDSESVWWAARIYWTRWKIEETFRFVKQSYNLEDIRVMKYRRLKNLEPVMNFVPVNPMESARVLQSDWDSKGNRESVPCRISQTVRFTRVLSIRATRSALQG